MKLFNKLINLVCNIAINKIVKLYQQFPKLEFKNMINENDNLNRYDYVLNLLDKAISEQLKTISPNLNIKILPAKDKYHCSLVMTNANNKVEKQEINVSSLMLTIMNTPIMPGFGSADINQNIEMFATDLIKQFIKTEEPTVEFDKIKKYILPILAGLPPQSLIKEDDKKYYDSLAKIELNDHNLIILYSINNAEDIIGIDHASITVKDLEKWNMDIYDLDRIARDNVSKVKKIRIEHINKLNPMNQNQDEEFDLDIPYKEENGGPNIFTCDSRFLLHDKIYYQLKQLSDANEYIAYVVTIGLTIISPITEDRELLDDFIRNSKVMQKQIAAVSGKQIMQIKTPLVISRDGISVFSNMETDTDD